MRAVSPLRRRGGPGVARQHPGAPLSGPHTAAYMLVLASASPPTPLVAAPCAAGSAAALGAPLVLKSGLAATQAP